MQASLNGQRVAMDPGCHGEEDDDNDGDYGQYFTNKIDNSSAHLTSMTEPST